MQMQCVICKVATVFLNIILLNFSMEMVKKIILLLVSALFVC
jgi:hypothetical protein